MICIKRYWIFLMILRAFCGAALAAEGPRNGVDLNPGWKFIRQDVPGGESSEFNDSRWTSINLPHTWNNLDGQDGGNNYYRGIGWYRLHVKADPGWARKEIYLKFDAASINASVFVNGKPAGKHAGSFGAFCFDITPLLNLQGDNVVAVKVSNAKDPDVAPVSGDFTMFGGIYRGVHLLILNPLSITPIDDGSSGVYVRQDKINAENANLTITTVLRNTGLTEKSPTVTVDLLDVHGTTVATIKGTGEVTSAGESFAQSLTLAHPHLWNARKDPYLYTVRVTLRDGQTVMDQVEQPVGLRFFRVDPDLGFFLNGHPYRLYGVNRHQDHLDKGWAISLEDHQTDFSNMMEMGCTGVRLSHYQHAQEFYDLCDHGGMVAWAEIPIVNTTTVSPEFDENAAQQLRELIKQSFNHPSICFWSLSNELGGSSKAPQQKQHQFDLQTRLNDEAHELDPTRLTTEATAVSPGRPQDAVTDVIAFNRYFGWYGGKPNELGADLDKLHQAYPNRGVGMSEFGAGGAISQHEANVKQPKSSGKWHPEEWQSLVHESAWRALKPRTWIWCTFIWAEHDFAVDGRNEGEHPGRNDKGLTTYDGKIRKDAFYFYQANWSADPMVYITERRFSPRPVADALIKIYSNCDQVTLTLNGQSLGSQTGNDIHAFVWSNAKLQTGENHLKAVGLREGKEYVDSCSIVLDINATDGNAPTTKPAN